MTSNLERQIKQYYESQELVAETIERLRAMIAAGPQPSRRRAARWFAAAAALAMVAISLIVMHDMTAVGRLLLHCADERWHVIDVALLPADCGRGLGSEIFDALEASSGLRSAS